MNLTQSINRDTTLKLIDALNKEGWRTDIMSKTDVHTNRSLKLTVCLHRATQAVYICNKPLDMPFLLGRVALRKLRQMAAKQSECDDNEKVPYIVLEQNQAVSR